MKNTEFNVYTAEKFMIPREVWTKEILSNFPEDIRKDLQSRQSGSAGIGHHNKLGWFVLCFGRGPFLAWSEKGEEG